jgi:hypothetical protein
MSVTTDQPALQVYTCNGIANNGEGKNVTIPRKKAHGGPKKYYPKHSCAVIEQVRTGHYCRLDLILNCAFLRLLGGLDWWNQQPGV